MRAFLLWTFALAALSLALIGCSKPEFKSVSIKVIDDETSKPVVGAKITAVCMGLSPYATNTYSTGSEGSARVMAYTAGIALVTTATGYEINTVGIASNEAVIKLKRHQ
jgi:hypothetical protein